MSKVDAWLRSALAPLPAMCWPPTCVLCGRTGRSTSVDLCAGCEADLPHNFSCCSICAHPLQGEAPSDAICGACLQRRPRFDTNFSALRYDYPVDHLIRGLKYGRDVVNGRVLGDLLATGIMTRTHCASPALLIPVPLARGRFRERGYNQALVLAERLHQRLSIPLRADVLVRTRETQEQAGLDQRERRKNIRRAFAVVEPLRVRHIALIDDVVTTGSTVNEIARVLKRAGVERVDVWSVARAAR